MGVDVNEQAGSEGPRDPFDYNLSYSPLTFDITDNWVSSFFWQPLGGYNFNSSLLKTALGGWQLGGIATLHTGLPLNLYSGFDNSFSGIGEDTPDVIGNYNLPNQSRANQIKHWFNTAAFRPNAIGTFGTLGNNALRSPGYWDVDLDVQKDFKFQDRYTLESRVSLYNAFNHANLDAPVNTLTSQQFGQILGASNPRVMELSLRLVF
jgi:hypothetical protein